MEATALQPRAFLPWWKVMRVAAAKPRRPRKKTARQKRLEDLLEVQGSEVNMMELLEVNELEVEVVLSGVMAILKPTACASYLFNHKRASNGIDGEMIE